jgi:hypothetical protein
MSPAALIVIRQRNHVSACSPNYFLCGRALGRGEFAELDVLRVKFAYAKGNGSVCAGRPGLQFYATRGRKKTRGLQLEQNKVVYSSGITAKWVVNMNGNIDRLRK